MPAPALFRESELITQLLVDESFSRLLTQLGPFNMKRASLGRAGERIDIVFTVGAEGHLQLVAYL